MSVPWLKPAESKQPQTESPLHANISPAEVRFGEPVRAVLTTMVNGQAVTKPVRVWRISPIGVEVVVGSEFGVTRLGQSFDIELTIGTASSKLFGVKATTQHKEQSHEILGLRLVSKSHENWSGEERRGQNRWSTSKEFMPAGIFANPGRFNDFVFFKVLNFSERGMQISTSLRNKFLLPGMKIESSISLPMVGQISVTFEIVNSALRSDDGVDTLALGCKFHNLSRQALEAISQYVFQFGPVASLRDMKTNGLLVAKAASGIDFRYVRTKEDYEQVLVLRRLAYGEAGKIAEDEDVSDIYDTRSRILIGVYRGQVIASVRLIFNEMGDKMEHEDFITLPQNFPRKDEICEITRVCTHPNFRGSDILMGLFRLASVTVAQSGRKFILGCATKDLESLYRKLGFEFTNLKYNHKQLGGLEHTVFLGDVLHGLAGKGVNPIIWNIVWAPVTSYLTSSQVLQYTGMDKVRMGVYKMFKPLSWMALRMSRRPKSRRQKALPKSA